MVKSGRVNANGSVGTGSGFNVTRISAGVYDVVSSYGALSSVSGGYIATVQLYNAAGTFCTSVNNVSPTTFRVTISASNTGVGTDCSFNFMVSKLL